MSNPAEIIGTLPALIGYRPNNTTAFIILDADKQVRMSGALHNDDPNPLDTYQHLMRNATFALGDDITVILVDYEVPVDLTGLDDERVAHWFAVVDQEWWCKDAMCPVCPQLGGTLDTVDNTVVADAVANGVDLARSRDQAVSHLAPLSDVWSDDQTAVSNTIATSTNEEELREAVTNHTSLPRLAAAYATSFQRSGSMRDNFYAALVIAREAKVLRDMLDDLDLMAPHIPANQGEDFIGALAMGHLLNGDGLSAAALLSRCRPSVASSADLARICLEQQFSPEVIAEALSAAIAHVQEEDQ